MPPARKKRTDKVPPTSTCGQDNPEGSPQPKGPTPSRASLASTVARDRSDSCTNRSDTTERLQGESGLRPKTRSQSRANSTTSTEEVQEAIKGPLKIPRRTTKGTRVPGDSPPATITKVALTLTSSEEDVQRPGAEEPDFLDDLYTDPEPDDIRPQDSASGRNTRSSGAYPEPHIPHGVGIETIDEEGEQAPSNGSGRLNVIQGVIRDAWDCMRVQHDEMLEMRAQRLEDIEWQQERS
ncbi:hypothetical protein BC835DRAFT_1420761 [Cytidiella melzeri]|nr:hypothetical protein BC835DRAFT_1420761 [Cytidiella melzeri]